MKKNGILSGALILSVGAVLAKVFSAVYRIFLTRILGGTGIGIYQLIFPLYSLFVVLASSGIPLAISKVIAKNLENSQKILKKCIKFMFFLTVILSLTLLLVSKPLATLQGKNEIAICYIILAPTIILVGVSSVLKGYFQGVNNFTPSALSNIFEQFIKMLCGLILTSVLIKISLIAGIIGAMVAIVLSEIISVVVLLCYVKSNPNSQKTASSPANIKDILKDVLPITLTTAILPISMFVDSILVVNLLSKNFPREVSIFLYGLESGAVATVVNLPTIFSFAIASAILPNITEKSHILNRNQGLSISIKIILVICLPFAICFVLLPERLLGILYGGKLVGLQINGTLLAGRLLAMSGIGVIFLALNQLYSTALQAVDQRFVTIRNLIIAVIIKFGLEVLFLPSKTLNIYVVAIANTVCYLVVMILNQLDVSALFKIKINYLFGAKLILSNLVMLVVILAVLTFSFSATNTIFALSLGGIIYLFMLYKTSIFTKKDKAMIKYKV